MKGTYVLAGAGPATKPNPVLLPHRLITQLDPMRPLTPLKSLARIAVADASPIRIIPIPIALPFVA